jgi:hypothetical protein
LTETPSKAGLTVTRLALHVAAGATSVAVIMPSLVYVAKSARVFAPSFNPVSEQL